MGIGEEEVEAVGEALLEFGLYGVVVGGAGVVAVYGDVLEAGEGVGGDEGGAVGRGQDGGGEDG